MIMEQDKDWTEYIFQKPLLMNHQQAHMQVGKHLYVSCDSQAAQQLQ